MSGPPPGLSGLKLLGKSKNEHDKGLELAQEVEDETEYRMRNEKDMQKYLLNKAIEAEAIRRRRPQRLGLTNLRFQVGPKNISNKRSQKRLRKLMFAMGRINRGSDHGSRRSASGSASMRGGSGVSHSPATAARRKEARRTRRRLAAEELTRLNDEHRKMSHEVLRHTFFIKKACSLCKGHEDTSKICRYCYNFGKDRSLSNSPSMSKSMSKSMSMSPPKPMHRCEIEKGKHCKGHWSKKCYCMSGPSTKTAALTGLQGLTKKQIEEMERYRRSIKNDQKRINADNGLRSDDMDEEDD
jgi:hypothetical protein